MTKVSGQFNLVGQSYIDPNDGTQRQFRDAQELWDTQIRNAGAPSAELKLIKQASEQSGIPFQSLYEFREATSGPLASRNATLFQGQDTQALNSALGGLSTLGQSGAGGLFGSLSRAAGGALGAVSENVIDPIAQTAKDNPALLFGAPLAIGALGGAFGAGGATGASAGGATGGALEPIAVNASRLAGGTLAPGTPVVGSGLSSAAAAAGPGLASSVPFTPANPAFSGGLTTAAKTAPTANQLGTSPDLKTTPIKATPNVSTPPTGGPLSNIGNVLGNFGPLIGAGLGAINANNAPDSQTITATNNPPAFALPALQEAIDASRQQFQSGGPEQFPGSQVAPFSDDTVNAMNLVRDRVNTGSPVLGEAQNNLAATLRGDFLSPESNPFLQQTFDNAADLTRNRLTSEFSRAGRDVSAAFPARSIELQHLAANLFGNNFARERGIQANAVNQAVPLSREDYFGPAQLANIGQAQQGQAQNVLSDQVRRFDFDQNRPELALNSYLNRVSQASGNYGAQSQTQPLYNDPLSGALGGAIVGNALLGNQQQGLGQNLLGGLLS